MLSFYKSEKSEGSSSIVFILIVDEVDVQNNLFHISSIFSKILLGSAYFSTSSHSNLPRTGNIKIVNTVTIIPITAYLIVLIAGLIFSSFPPDNIKSRPHHKINKIENIQANKTKIDIVNNTKSQNSILSQNSHTHVSIAYAVSITIKLC